MIEFTQWNPDACRDNELHEHLKSFDEDEEQEEEEFENDEDYED